MKSVHHLTTLIIALFLLNSIQVQAFCEYTQSLKADDLAMGNLLKWTTINESGLKEFIVERSTDGIEYQNIGKVDAQGGVQEADYTFLDVAAEQGLSYYRLKSIDADGSHEYSTVAIADMLLKNNFTVVSLSPPSNDGQLEMVVNSKQKNEVGYEIRDLDNNVYYTAKHQLNNGINIITINIVDELLEDDKVFRIVLQGEAESEILTFKSDGY